MADRVGLARPLTDTIRRPHPVQRVGPMAGLPDVLARYGVPLPDVLAGLPVTKSDLRFDAFLPIRLITEILNRSAARTGQPIGLLLGKAHNHLSLGPVGQVMSYCDTLGMAITTFVGLQIANSTAGAAHLTPVGDDYALGFGLLGPDLGTGHIYDISMAVGCNMLRDLTGGAVAPLEILLSRPMPADLAPYRELANCPVRFNQTHTCLILSRRSLEVRLPTADPKAREELLALIRARMGPEQIALPERVKHAIRSLLFAGPASLPQVAARLNIHPRTLERRLAEENAVFEKLKDEVRLAASCDLLALTELTASDIATALGYASPSAFVRAFRRWTGTSPAAWRRAPLSPKDNQMS
jgi:AraC-like DNA-binding protein